MNKQVTQTNENITKLNEVSNFDYTLEEITTKMIVDMAKAISTLTKTVKNEMHSRKQYELGKLFDSASVAAKRKDSKVKIKDIQAQLQMPSRTWENYVSFYNTHEAFKNILSLKNANTRVFPTSSMSVKLRGNDSEDKLENWENILEMFETPTSKEVINYNKTAKEINPDKPWKVKPDEITAYREALAEAAKAQKDADETEEAETTTAATTTTTTRKTAWDKLSISEQIEQKWIHCFETTEYDVSEYFERSKELDIDYRIPKDIADAANHVTKKQWKTMYKKGAKCFHPDTGGENNELNLWKSFAKLMEDFFTLEEKNELRQKYLTKQEEIDRTDITIFKKWYNKKNKD